MKIFIQLPKRRSVNISGNWKYLPFPYMIFLTRVVKVGGASRGFLLAGLANHYPEPNTILGHIPLSNITEYTVCLGKHYFKSNKEIVNSFWSSEFQWSFPENGIPKEFENPVDNRVDYNKWHQLSLEEIVNINWVNPLLPADTLGRLVERFDKTNKKIHLKLI